MIIQFKNEDGKDFLTNYRKTIEEVTLYRETLTNLIDELCAINFLGATSVSFNKEFHIWAEVCNGYEVVCEELLNVVETQTYEGEELRKMADMITIDTYC